MKQATIEQLAAISVFSRLQPEQLAYLQPHSQVRVYQVGEMVSQEGDHLPPRLYALVDGLLRMTKTATSGKETILRTLSRGEIFAAPALFGDGLAPATVTVEQEAQVLTVDREALLKAIQAYPDIALAMMAVFNQRLQQLHEMVHGLMSERAIVRIARLIQFYAREQGIEETSEGMRLQSHLSYYEIARSVGITYEECVRLFKQLQPLVVYHRSTVTVLDWEGLEAIAAGQF